ncbi:MAG TPA: hypothetical protein VMI56_03520 [Reyranella sp.]|nr:hypothetical protein [Reyranella sp.]
MGLPFAGGIFTRTLMCLLGGLAFIVAMTPSVRADDCGIDHVERTHTGVKVFFSKPTLVTVVRPEKRPLRIMVDTAATSEDMDSAGQKPIRAVSARLGDQMFLTWSAHSGCEMVVATLGDQIGIYETLGISAPGLPRWQKSNFTPAK